jgi:nitroreductase
MPTDPVPAELDRLAHLVRRRRTNLLMDHDREIPVELVETLCELATWAPCHKRTWPWQFALVTGTGRERLGSIAADAMTARGDDPGKVAKTRTKYLRAPAMLVVGSAPGDSELRTVENRDATAAGIQNLLLGATAAGLASYWSSCPKGANEPVVELCGFEAGTTVVALVYLGWPAGQVPVPERPPVTLARVE